MARLWTKTDSERRPGSEESAFGAYAPDPASNDAANYGYGRSGAGKPNATWPEPGSNDAANYGYGRQGADGYAGGYAPDFGSNDAANYGYGREGLDDTPLRGVEFRIIDDFAVWAGADPVATPDSITEDSTDMEEHHMSQSSEADAVREYLKGDWMVDSENIDVTVAGNEAILSGCVATQAQKLRAEDLALAASGISAVRNQIRVGTSGVSMP